MEAASPAQQDQPERTGAEAVRHVAHPNSKPSEGEMTAALEWFVKSEPDAGENYTRRLELNFGTEAEPEWVPWTIRPVDEQTMRQIRRASAQRAERARDGRDPQEERVNLQIIIAATVDPNIREAAKLMGIADPTEALRIRLSRKPGFIAQLAGEIGSLSGFDSSDVREAEAVEAGKG